MKKDIFRFVDKKLLEDDPPVLLITKGSIQSFAKENYGRELTDADFYKISNESFNANEFGWRMNELIGVVVRYFLGKE